ncbi:MAG: ATP-grasp domain-containing protein, partial [Chloroflexi bacterium]|nr:ATP-grasp domain-containing protein [Chloroflexota bacterium]
KSVVKTIKQLKKQVDYIWTSYEHPSIVEEFLPGREFRVFVIGNNRLQVLPPEEIIYELPPGKPQILTYFAKWVPGHEYFTGTREVCPAKIDADLAKELNTLAKRSYRALKCHGYASIDMRQDKTGKLMVIEVNPNTDISANGSAMYPVQEAGIEYHMFIKKVINLAKIAYIIRNKK